MANPGSYGATTPSTPPPPSSSGPAVSGSFPTTPTGEGLGVNGVQVANLSVTQFLSDYDISSTEENTYLTDTNGKLSLNENALMLMQYKAMDRSQRQDVQQALANATLLAPASATGDDTPSGVAAFKSAITTAATQGTDVNTFLQNYSGTNNAENQLSGAISNTEKEAAAPTTATVENPTTLAATITNAFNQSEGYSPDPAQVQAFISQVQGQDVANAQAPHQAAEAQLAQLRSDQSALSKMGPNDIDSIITAYTNAIHGINPSAGSAANQQGVATGTAPSPTAQNANPANVVAGSMGQNTTTGPNAPLGVLGALKTDLNPLTLLHPGGPQLANPGGVVPGNQTTTTTTGGALQPAPQAPIGSPGTVPTYGGIYALTPADWTEIKKLYPGASKYATAGAAPVNVQHAAFTTLLQNVYDNNGGSWADAIVKIAGGTVGAAGSEKELGSSTNIQTFATGIANQVNNQLMQLTNTINTNNVTVKTTAPDASAEAALAAKTADPVGYYAANYASAGSLLNQMLAGAPQMYDQNTADTFTGPVPAGEAAASSTPATVAA